MTRYVGHAGRHSPQATHATSSSSAQLRGRHAALRTNGQAAGVELPGRVERVLDPRQTPRAFGERDAERVEVRCAGLAQHPPGLRPRPRPARRPGAASVAAPMCTVPTPPSASQVQSTASSRRRQRARARRAGPTRGRGAPGRPGRWRVDAARSPARACSVATSSGMALEQHVGPARRPTRGTRGGRAGRAARPGVASLTAQLEHSGRGWVRSVTCTITPSVPSEPTKSRGRS